MQQFNDVGQRVSVSSQPFKSVSFDTPPNSAAVWEPAIAPRHNTYPLPHSDRDVRWPRPSSPAARETSLSTANSVDSPQMRSAFENPLSVPSGQEIPIGTSNQTVPPIDHETPSPRVAWERAWPGAALTRGGGVLQPPEISSMPPMATMNATMRTPPEAVDPVYGPSDMRWPESTQLAPAAYVPVGTKWVPPVSMTESGNVPVIPSWPARPPVMTRRVDSNGPLNDRHNQTISTLFIAGFPDDITEREFANIFLFAKGFEASMLKYPSPNPPRSEDTNEKSTGDHDKETPAQESSGSRNKQIIGFAKFYTREEAFEAREILNGFRIDPARGCILKAELAKKNLHTKRNTPFVAGKHVAINAHTAASRNMHDPPLTTADPHPAYTTTLLNTNSVPGHAKHYPTPLNLVTLADKTRDASAMMSTVPNSAPPRMDPVRPALNTWPMVSSGFETVALPTSDVHSFATPQAAPMTAPIFDPTHSQGLKIPPAGHESLPKRPDASVRQASLADTRRAGGESRYMGKEPPVGERAADVFTPMDPATSLSRMHLSQDSPVSDVSSSKDRTTSNFTPLSRHDTGDSDLNSLLATVPQRRSPVSMFTSPSHDHAPMESREATASGFRPLASEKNEDTNASSSRKNESEPDQPSL